MPLAIIVIFGIVLAAATDSNDGESEQVVGGQTEAPLSAESEPSASTSGAASDSSSEETMEPLLPLFDARESCGEASSLTLAYGEASEATIDSMLLSLTVDPTSAEAFVAAVQEHQAGAIGVDAALALQQCIIALEDSEGVRVATPYVDDLASSGTPVEVTGNVDPAVATAAECLTHLSGPSGAWAWAEGVYQVGRDVFTAAVDGEDAFQAAEAAPAPPDDMAMESLRQCADS